MTKKLDINQSKASLDYFMENNTNWFSSFEINNYPVVMIFWNLFLITIPWLLGISLKYCWQKTKFKVWYHKLIGLGLAGLWLLFVPNTAYIITDVRHINNFCLSPNPYNVCLDGAWLIMVFFTYAVLGWLAFVFLVRQMKPLVKNIWGDKAVGWYIALIIPLIALGLLLGLLNRWNSWEIFTTPLSFFYSVQLYFTDWHYFGNWLIFSGFLYILYWLGDFIFSKDLYKMFKDR